MISETDVDKALEKLTEPNVLAPALGYKLKCEHMLKVTKALEMKKHDSSVAAQEREAYASIEYRMAIKQLVEATIAYEKAKADVEAAKIIIDMWRTQQANQRHSL